MRLYLIVEKLLKETLNLETFDFKDIYESYFELTEEKEKEWWFFDFLNSIIDKKPKSRTDYEWSNSEESSLIISMLIDISEHYSLEWEYCGEYFLVSIPEARIDAYIYEEGSYYEVIKIPEEYSLQKT